MSEMTHDLLRKAALSSLKKPYAWNNKDRVFCGQCSIVLSELVSAAYEIPDAIGWHSGRSVLIECKVSRSDFFADAKKPHRLAGTGAGEQRYFLTSPGLISAPEVPRDWGLLELHGRTVRIVVQAKRRSLDADGHASEKRMLLSTISRIRAREFLIISRDCAEDLLSDVSA